jgi:hypothetical protein
LAAFYLLSDTGPEFDVVYAIRPQPAMMRRLADYQGPQHRWTPEHSPSPDEAHDLRYERTFLGNRRREIADR